MTPQPKPLPDNSASATAQIIHDLTINKRLNGEWLAVKDAEAIAYGCFAFIQTHRGHEALSRFLQLELAASNDRIVRDAKIARGRP